MKVDMNFLNKWLFKDETTFHVQSRVNTHDVITWGCEHPHVTYEVERASPTVNI
jgi:hypothetical protein